MSSRTTSKATRSAISSQGSEAGHTPCASPGGPMTDLFGREVAPANPSARLGSKREPKTSGTCGPSFDASSPSARLQLSLESKLRAALEGSGSPLFGFKWKHWDMQSGPPICALRARVRRTSDNDCGSWPTPNAIPPTRGGLQSNPEKALQRRQQGHQLNLDDAVCLASWTTPQAHDSSPRGKGQKAKHGTKHGCACLATDAGKTSNGSNAQTGSKGQLNPAFSLWLMGYPPEWLSCVPPATRSSRKSRQSSSKQQCEGDQCQSGTPVTK